MGSEDEARHKQLRNLLSEYEAELDDARDRLREASQRVDGLEAAVRGMRAALALEGVELAEASAGGDQEAEPDVEEASIAEVAAYVLEQAGRAMSAEELIEGMTRIGWTSDAKDPLNAVRTALYREDRKDNGRIKRVGRGRFKAVEADKLDPERILAPLKKGLDDEEAHNTRE